MKDSAERLRHYLAESNRLHATYLDDTQRRDEYQRFIDLQLDYFLPHYEDLRHRPGYGDAIDYIVADMVGPEIASRDAELARVVPMMSRVLPGGALSALALALELNARVLTINLAIEDVLRPSLVRSADISERDYCLASRSVADFTECESLIAMTRRAGESLQHIVRIPMIGTTLKMMRGPARLAGVGGLQVFLERGHRIFTAIEDVPALLDTVEARMTRVFRRVFEAPEAQLGQAPIVRHAGKAGDA